MQGTYNHVSRTAGCLTARLRLVQNTMSFAFSHAEGNELGKRRVVILSCRKSKRILASE